MAVLGDPHEFPITIDHPRDPMNWYGRTKLLSEQAIDEFDEGRFPAHQFMISNLYGHHWIDDRRISKGTVTNFFVDRPLAGDPLTVYELGTQSRNFVHAKDIARAFIRSAERLDEQVTAGETGVEKYELASGEDPSVMTVAEWVAEIAAQECGTEIPVERIENPRDNETMIETFDIDTTRASEQLHWNPQESVRESVQRHITRESKSR
jgi:nucleoside-diphosphate-sugar epimerase